MDNLTTFKRLDVVLNYLKQNPQSIEYILILSAMKESGLVSTQAQLKALLDKLEGDNYILKIVEPGYYDHYIIKPDGELFIGYVETERQATLAIQTQQQTALDTSSKEETYATNLLFWYKLSGVGTIGLLAWVLLQALTQVFQYFCHCEFVWQK